MTNPNQIPASEYLAYSIWRDVSELSKRNEVLHESFKIILRDSALIIEGMLKK